MVSKDLQELRRKIRKPVDAMKKMLATVESEDRGFTDEEKTEFQELKDKTDHIADIIRGQESLEELPDPEPRRRTEPVENASRVEDHTQWRDSTGREIRVLHPDEKFKDLDRSSEPLSLGRAIRAMIIGSWDGAEAEQRALSTTANPSAGILIPNPLAATVIDLARARSVLVRAGAKTIDMPSSTLKIARVSGDATVEVKSENVTFTGSDVTFDAVEMTAYTLGVLTTMSRETAADAPNAVSIIEQTIADKLAERIDYYGLQGTGSAQPLGLINFSGTNSVAVGGAVDWDDVLNGIKENDIDNHTSNAFLMSPLNASNLRQLKVNAEANHYASPPPIIGNLSGLVTTNMPDSTMVVGDFSQFIIGLRQGPTIEVSTDGNSAFEKHQVAIKITWRGAFNTEHRDAFTLLTGIA